MPGAGTEPWTPPRPPLPFLVAQTDSRNARSMTVSTDDVLLVHGGTPLEGEIRVRGAKNLVPKAMVAALLGSGPSRLRNVPDIRDVRVVRGLLQLHGVTVRPGEEPGELVMDPSHVESANVADIDAHA